MDNSLVGLLSRLVSIDSVNPDLVPGARGEREVADFVAGWLREAGLEVSVEDSGRPGRPNVVGVARGSGGGRSLMLNAHMDTVGVAGMEAPFTPEVRGGRLHGRGAVDTKSALAAFMLCAARARGAGLRGDVVLAAVVDEEYASAGTETLARRRKADAALVGEPTGLEIVTAHKGFAWFEIETLGNAAHGSRPDIGQDAIAKMGKVLTAIDEMALRLSRAKPHRLLGPGSVHASLVQGGQELSSYPAACRLSLERRTIPGETADGVAAELQAILDRLSAEDPRFHAVLRPLLSRGHLEVRWDEPIVAVLKEQVTRVTGGQPTLAGMPVWTDAALLADAGIPSVIFGPRGEGLHGRVEWVDLASVEACRDIVSGVIGSFCA
jgi:acetylornithine deacetylase